METTYGERDFRRLLTDLRALTRQHRVKGMEIPVLVDLPDGHWAEDLYISPTATSGTLQVPDVAARITGRTHRPVRAVLDAEEAP